MHFCYAANYTVCRSNKYCNELAPNLFFECRCGPARHAAMLQLKTNSTAKALDNVPQMLEYAKKIAAKAGASLEFLCEDMRSFSLQVWPCLHMHTTHVLIRNLSADPTCEDVCMSWRRKLAGTSS